MSAYDFEFGSNFSLLVESQSMRQSIVKVQRKLTSPEREKSKNL